MAEDIIYYLPEDASGYTGLHWYDEVKKSVKRKASIIINFEKVNNISDLHLVHILNLQNLARNKNAQIKIEGATAAIEERLNLLCEQEDASFIRPDHPSIFDYLGDMAVDSAQKILSFSIHAADTLVLSITMLFKPKSRAKGSIANQMTNIGINAFPIVMLLIFLVGMVLAMQSAEQLRQFGANIFVTDLTVISMAREMGPLITAIIISGRSGASIAAEIATMKVSEELDALQTMGIDPFSYVVLPKLYGITFTMPFLTIFADIIGIAGGMVIAVISLDIQPITFINRAADIAQMWDFLNGIIRSFVFGWLIVLISSWFGLHASGGAEGVGKATTGSVVTSIFMIIIADAILGLIFYL